MARMLDEAGYDGMVLRSHDLSARAVVAVPRFADRQADVGTRYRLAGLVGAHRRDGRASPAACGSPTPSTSRRRGRLLEVAKAGRDRRPSFRRAGCRWRSASDGCARSSS